MARSFLDRMFAKVNVVIGRSVAEIRKAKEGLTKAIEDAAIPKDRGQLAMNEALLKSYARSKVEKFPFVEIVDDLISNAKTFPKFEAITDEAQDRVDREEKGLPENRLPWEDRVDYPEILDVFNAALNGARLADQDLTDAARAMYDIRKKESKALNSARGAAAYGFALTYLGEEKKATVQRRQDLNRAQGIGRSEAEEAVRRGMEAGDPEAYAAHQQMQMMDFFTGILNDPAKAADFFQAMKEGMGPKTKATSDANAN